MNAKQELCKKIIDSLKNEPEDWSYGNYTFDNNKWGIKIWTGNGLLFIGVYAPTTLYFNLIQKIKIRKAIRESKALKLIKQKP